MTEQIEPLKISVELPKKVLDNLERAGYIDEMRSISGDLVIRIPRSRSTFNGTIQDMIVKQWSY